MKKYKWIVILLNLVFLLIYFNYTVIQEEKLLKKGKLIFLELIPADPRSWMQGDYMDLRYAISRGINFDSLPKRGYCVIALDERDIASKVRVQEKLTPLAPGEYPIAYNAFNKWDIRIGVESFFFQEGQGGKYEKAKYGGIKIDKYGNSLLIGLYDEQLQKIE